MHYEEAGGSVRVPTDSESDPQENYCLSLAKATGWIQLKTYRHLGTEYTEVTSTDGWAVTDDGLGDWAPQNPEDIKFPNPGKIKGSQQSFCMRKPCNEDEVGEEYNLPECCPPGLGGPVPLSDVWNHMRSQNSSFGDGENRCNWANSPDYGYQDKNAKWTWIWIQYGWGKTMPCCHCDEDEGDDVGCRGEKNEFEWSLDFKVPSKDVFKTISDILDRDLAHKPCPPSGSTGTTAAMTSDDDQKAYENMVLVWERRHLTDPYNLVKTPDYVHVNQANIYCNHVRYPTDSWYLTINYSNECMPYLDAPRPSYQKETRGWTDGKSGGDDYWVARRSVQTLDAYDENFTNPQVAGEIKTWQNVSSTRPDYCAGLNEASIDKLTSLIFQMPCPCNPVNQG